MNVLKALVESLNTKILQLTNQTNTVDNPRLRVVRLTTANQLTTLSQHPPFPNNIPKNNISSDHKYNIVVFEIKICMVVPEDLSMSVASTRLYQFSTNWITIFNLFL